MLQSPWINWVAWLLVLLGWLVVNHQNNLRESRKELRASLDNIVKDIDALKELSLKYFTTRHKDSYETAFRIKAELARLIRTIERLSNNNPSFNVMPHLGEFMDAVSGDDFENDKRSIKSYSNNIDTSLYNIPYCAENLVQAIELSFANETKSFKCFRFNIFKF